MDIYLKTPGSTLIGLDRITFDDIQVAITKSTNEYLLRPDWDANLRVVELVKSVNNLDLLHEVTLVLRKKLRASQPKVVVLTLRLMEALTTNCGTNWFYALNAEPVTKELGNVARKYIAKTGPENKEVTDTVLDLIQAWGEAFLPKKKQFPNIVEIYFTLRKEGLPFKVNNQFDPTRVPIFEKPSVSDAGGVYLDSQTDAILAATLQASMDMHQPSPARRASASSSPNTNTSSSSSFPGPAQRLGSATSSGSAGGGGGGAGNNKSNNRRTSATNSLIESMSISMTILKELIVASTSIFDLKSNDVINEIIDQIKEYQTQIHVSIESSMDNPELLSNLFKYNDYSQTLLSIYSDIKDGSLSLTEGQKVITTALNFDGENTTPDNAGGKSDNKPAATATADLLDYNSVAEVSAKPVASAPAAVAHVQPAPVTQSNIDLDFFSAPVAKPVATTSSNAPIAAAVQAPAPVASPPAPLNKTPSAAIPRLAPPPSGKVPALAPPPKAGSTVQRSGSISIADNSNQKPVAPVQAPAQPVAPAVAPSSSSGLLDFDPFGDSKSTPTLVPTPVVAPAPAPIQPFAAFPPQQAAPNPAFPQPAAPFAAFPSQPLQPIPAPAPAAGPIPGTYPQYPPHGAYPHPPPGAYPHVQPGYPAAAPPAGYPYPPNPNPYPAAGLYPPQPAPFGFPPNPNPHPNPIPITQPAPSAIPPNNPTKPAQPPADNPFDLF